MQWLEGETRSMNTSIVSELEQHCSHVLCPGCCAHVGMHGLVLTDPRPAWGVGETPKEGTQTEGDKCMVEGFTGVWRTVEGSDHYSNTEY